LKAFKNSTKDREVKKSFWTAQKVSAVSIFFSKLLFWSVFKNPSFLITKLRVFLHKCHYINQNVIKINIFSTMVTSWMMKLFALNVQESHSFNLKLMHLQNHWSGINFIKQHLYCILKYSFKPNLKSVAAIMGEHWIEPHLKYICRWHKRISVPCLLTGHYSFWSCNLSIHVWFLSTPDQHAPVSHIDKKACEPTSFHCA